MSKPQALIRQWFAAVPRSPLGSRGGPESGGNAEPNGAKGLAMILPSTMAGAGRAAWADGHEGTTPYFADATQAMEKSRHQVLRHTIEVRGPLLGLLREDGSVEPLLPVPADAARRTGDHRGPVWLRMTPSASSQYPSANATAVSATCSNMPYGLCPVGIDLEPDDAQDDALPWWSANAVLRWLSQSKGSPHSEGSLGVHPGPVPDLRTSVSIDASTGAQRLSSFHQSLRRDGRPPDWHLPSRPRLPGPAELVYLARFGCPEESPLDFANSLSRLEGVVRRMGGDGPSVRFRAVSSLASAPPSFEQPISNPLRWSWVQPEINHGLAEALDQLKEGDWFRVMLLTPAIFTSGWYPEWLSNQDVGGQSMLCGRFMESGPHVRLRSAAFGRHRQVGGYSMLEGLGRPSRNLVPEGAVYWFELTEPAQVSPQRLSGWWLESMADGAQDRRDGWGQMMFGLHHV